MAGPKVEIPGALQEMFDYERDPEGNVIRIFMKPDWAAYLSAVQQVTFSVTRAGSTAARPTSTMLRWPGMPFFDQQVGKPVWLKYATSNVWVDATGSVA
jgi:hypothetical protein